MKNSLGLSLFISLVCCAGLYAQEKVELKEFLPDIEASFEVRFSYREQDLEDVQIMLPQKEMQLLQLLDFLEGQTSLKFEVLDSRYIAISSSPKLISFCGIILDSTTGEPLSGASIATLDNRNSHISNPDGRFYLEEIPHGTELQIRFLGFKETIVKATAEGSCVDIFLEPRVFSLRETVVVNYLTAGIAKRKDGSTFIDTERFGTLPGQVEPDILQTVESLPGVESVNETISNINIRGGTSDQNLVLFDGIKMYLTGHFFGLISAFNPGLVDEVQVVKNGSSSRLNDGVSGTIEVFSQDEIEGRFSGGVGIDLVSAGAFLKVPVSEDLELHFSGRRSINDLVDTPTYANYFSRTFQDSEVALNIDNEREEDSDFGYYDTSLKALYDVDQNHKLRFSFMQISNDLNYAEYDFSAEVRKSNLEQDNLVTGSTWKAEWTPNFSTETTAYLTRYRLNAMNYDVETEQRLVQQNEVLESGLKMHALNSLSNRLDLLSGYQFYEVGVSNIEKLNKPFFSSTIKNVVRAHALFSELEFSGKSTFLRAGLRLNYLPKFNQFLPEPRFSLNQKLGQKFSIKLLGEFKSQTTSQVVDLQEDFLGVENRRWILADQEVYPLIKSKQVSGGLDFKAAGWYIDLEAYYKEVEGISTSNQGFQDQHEFIRTSGSYTGKGLELLVNKKAGPLNAYVTYTFGRNHYHFEALEPESFPSNFDIRHSASIAANYVFSNFKFSLGGYMRSGKPFTKPVEEKETRRDGNNWIVNYAGPNSASLPPFCRVDMSASYSFEFSKTSELQISLGIINLLDRENVINRYYRVDRNDPTEAVEINNLSLGFTPNTSLHFRF